VHQVSGLQLSYNKMNKQLKQLKMTIEDSSSTCSRSRLCLSSTSTRASTPCILAQLKGKTREISPSLIVDLSCPVPTTSNPIPTLETIVEGLEATSTDLPVVVEAESCAPPCHPLLVQDSSTPSFPYAALPFNCSYVMNTLTADPSTAMVSYHHTPQLDELVTAPVTVPGLC
jgi:hypothetical protein